MNTIGNLLQTILGTGQNISNYFSTPSNPYSVKSPIPNDQLVTRNLPSGFKSPVQKEQIIQHVQGGSRFQNDMGQAKQNAQQWGNLFMPQKDQPVQKPAQPSTQPIRVPTATPTTAPVNDLAHFTTVPTEQIPPDYKNLITASASANKIPPALLASLLFSEHGFSRDPGFNYNTDGSYDRGPAQINSSAHPEVTDEQALDPNFAIPWAARLLANHINNLGLQRGIVAYNAGEYGATQISDIINYPSYQKVVSGLSPQLRKALGL